MDAAGLTQRLAKRTRGRPGALALVTSAETLIVRQECAPDADFEIGSISKGVTGLLYHCALARGEVTADTELGQLLPLADSPAATIRLADLATHRSGLPRVVGGRVLGRSIELYRHGTNPFEPSIDQLLTATRSAKLRPGRAAYSNSGFQLLGHALAAASGLNYIELLQTRVAAPLGLSPCYVPATLADLAPGAVAGSAGRRPTQPWVGLSLGPAGGIRASVEAMAKLAQALLNGSAPGVAALDPVTSFAGPAVRIGAGWLTTQRPRRNPVTWHNGGTGGFRSWLGLDRERGAAVVVLSASARSVDALGMTLLDELTPG